MIPILLILGLAYAGFAYGRRAAASPKQPVVTAGRLNLPAAPQAYVRDLFRKVTSGQPVTRWLVNEATREAYERGDWKTVSAITKRFPRRLPASPDAVPPPEAGGPPQVEDGGAAAVPVESPLEAVDHEAWGDFLDSMRTREPGFSNNRYIGQFEHNRSRLQLLGIEEPTTPEGEVAAFSADIKSLDEENGTLVAEFSGEVIEVAPGDEVAVTRSGILGLLKAAGPENARSWLTTPSDRKRFPRTTATFQRANGVF